MNVIKLFFIRCSNRAAAFLSLVKLSKALADADTTIKLNPQWEKVNQNKRKLFFSFSVSSTIKIISVSLCKQLISLLQGYFRKGCVLEAMEKYEDVNFLLLWYFSYKF